jgi:hypothetical protein
VKTTAVVVPPPGAGLYTVTCAVPGATMSDAGIAAVSRVAETKVVVRSAPFQRTTEPAANPLPSTVRVKAELPAAAVEGVIPVSEGAGFPLMVKASAGVVPPPGAGVKTVTWAVPTAAMSDAGIDAVSRVAES